MRSREIINKLTEKEKGYLVGIFFGDGYMYHDNKYRHYNVEFYLNSINDVDIQKFLIRILKKIELNPNIFKDKRYNCNRIRVRSKLLMQYLTDIKIIRNKEFDIGFVSGLIDSDGYFNYKKNPFK